MFYCSSCSCYS